RTRHHRDRTGVTTVIALGGNALMRPGERGTAAEQRANLRTTCEALRPLLDDDELVVTHGNGPQVGNELVRQERAADEVPPLPLEIVELEAVRTLLASGTIAVACGGGGIPVSSRNGRLSGLDAVIDKDRASAVLAVALGAERLVILTDVEAVYRGWGTPAKEKLRELDADSAEALLPELAAGSMRPKLEASLAFAKATGHGALIASAASLAEALAGRAGTRIKR